MKWKTTPETRTDVLHEWRPSHNVVFFVSDEGDRRFCNFMPSVHHSTVDDANYCKQVWPREAIRLMRAELDRVEAILNQQEQVTNETTV